MNEPHDMNGAWSRAAQVGLDAIRSIEPQRLVLVPGDHWTGAWSWKRFNDHFSVHDGSGRVIYEAHQYFYPDRSGLYRQSYDQSSAYPDIGTDLVRPFAQGLNEIGYVEGQSVAIEYRWADGRLSPLITNLVGRKVSVLAR
jgi:endoglucanase